MLAEISALVVDLGALRVDPGALWARAASAALAFGAGLLTSPSQIAAHLAAAAGIGLVAAGSLVRTMMPLRWLAVGSNLGLLVYGALHPSAITLTIAATLLPINLYRAIEVTRLSRRVHRAAAAAELATLWLRPYMVARRLRAGQVLFSKGDTAEHLFLLVDGRMELSDIGEPLDLGHIFGEIALFSPDGLRTHTVRCVTACTVLEIHDSTVRQLFYQHPAFGFHLIELLAANYSRNMRRTEARLTSTAAASTATSALASASASASTSTEATTRATADPTAVPSS
jgi:CRP-like cAMP-binding protein